VAIKLKLNVVASKEMSQNSLISKTPYSCGLGLRTEFMHDVYANDFKPFWFEITPENWMYMHAKHRKTFERIVSDFEIVAHGLSLSIGSNTPLDKKFLTDLKSFLDEYEIEYYSEHLSFCSLDNKQMYELLPLPMTENMVNYICDRVDAVQNILGRSIALENASYYYVPYAEMEETDFINEVIKRSGAKLLLDVNNVFVNSHNHKFDPKAFLDKIDYENIAYMHIAGHMEVSEELFIDTHGEKVKDAVWDLLEYVKEGGVDKPLLLERDNDVPDYVSMMQEYKYMQKIYS